MHNTNGVILQESADIVVIATGLRSKSRNSKTGGMIQVYILYRHESPLMAVRYGLDSMICGECPHRGVIVDGRAVGRRCYVQVGKAPKDIWKCYLRGGYRHADASEYPALFGGRMVRWGAYGDPAFINREVVEGISAVASGRTGYSHQWKTAPSWMRHYFMASCDSPQESMLAVRMGWRYFRVSPKGNDIKLTGEISCPASAEAGKRTVCANCQLCDGAKDGDRRKNIVIQDHSRISSSNPFVVIG